MISVVAERRRGKNGAAKRYKGPRELVGARIPPELLAELDDARSAVGATRNDWIAAAIHVSLQRRGEIAAALRQPQLTLDNAQEVLDQSA